MDWNGKVITFVGPEDGHIYDCTINVRTSLGGNIFCVDMRNIFPSRYKNCKTRQGHAMFADFSMIKIDDGVEKFRCFNSWGEKDKEIWINIDEKATATCYYANFNKIVRRGYDGRPDEIVYK